eukprot:5887637-Pleurochrysis_carterae.AAC.1
MGGRSRLRRSASPIRLPHVCSEAYAVPRSGQARSTIDRPTRIPMCQMVLQSQDVTAAAQERARP